MLVLGSVRGAQAHAGLPLLVGRGMGSLIAPGDDFRSLNERMMMQSRLNSPLTQLVSKGPAATSSDDSHPNRSKSNRSNASTSTQSHAATHNQHYIDMMLIATGVV